jgi:hypothetical protein
VPGSLRFDNVWLRPFVGDEPPGAQQTEIEALVRPACEMYSRCEVLKPLNSCLYLWQQVAPGIREETFAAGIGCIAELECNDLSAHYRQCWVDASPESLAYHDEFLATCLGRTEACFGQAESDCYGYDESFIFHLPYYSEALVSEFSACVAEDIECASLYVGACMGAAASRYGLDF